MEVALNSSNHDVINGFDLQEKVKDLVFVN